MPCKFHIIGTPLNESASLDSQIKEILKDCALVIGERRKMTTTHLKRLGLTPEETLFMDPSPKKGVLKSALLDHYKKQHSVALMSDCGMPILFDPGKEALEMAKEIGFEIKSLPSATSFGAAMAISGFEPPFWVEGFLPQKTPERQRRLKELANIRAPIVLMDTPYRFELLLKEALVLGPQKAAFLATHLSMPQEAFYWGKVSNLSNWAKKRGLKKAEFVLIISHDS